MFKRTNIIGIVVFFIFVLFSLSFAEETLTITTYYPSPYGSYNQLTTTGNTYLATSSGSVGIGTASTTDHFQVNDSGTATERFGVRSGSNNLYAYGAYQTAWSDARLKKDVQPQHDILERVMAVKPVTYYWKPEAKLDKKMHYGVIAQELQKVFPTLVYEDQDGHLSVQRDEIQFILIQAVKELKAEKDALKARIEALEKRR